MRASSDFGVANLETSRSSLALPQCWHLTSPMRSRTSTIAVVFLRQSSQRNS